MANEKQQLSGTARFICSLVVIVISVGIAWGVTRTQVCDNTDDIMTLEKEKLDKEIFNMYVKHQSIMAGKIDKNLEKIDGKIDEALKRP